MTRRRWGSCPTKCSRCGAPSSWGDACPACIKAMKEEALVAARAAQEQRPPAVTTEYFTDREILEIEDLI